MTNSNISEVLSAVVDAACDSAVEWESNEAEVEAEGAECAELYEVAASRLSSARQESDTEMVAVLVRLAREAISSAAAIEAAWGIGSAKAVLAAL